MLLSLPCCKRYSPLPNTQLLSPQCQWDQGKNRGFRGWHLIEAQWLLKPTWNQQRQRWQDKPFPSGVSGAVGRGEHTWVGIARSLLSGTFQITLSQFHTRICFMMSKFPVSSFISALPSKSSDDHRRNRKSKLIQKHKRAYTAAAALSKNIMLKSPSFLISMCTTELQ